MDEGYEMRKKEALTKERLMKEQNPHKTSTGLPIEPPASINTDLEAIISPADALNTAIHDLDFLSAALQHLHLELTDGEFIDSPKEPSERPHVCLQEVLMEGPERIHKKREECQQIVMNLRNVLL